MFSGAPIPQHAEFDDPIWTGRFLDMANAMVLMGAKPKLIMRYTGLSQKAVTMRYKRLTGEEAPCGHNKTNLPKFFATPHNRGGLDFNMQAAAFAGIYLKLEEAMGEPVNLGWLLLTSYQAYVRLTDTISEAVPKLTRLSINQAYTLATHLGISDRMRNSATLALKDCGDCGTNYLVLTEAEIDNQRCPMCAIHGRYATWIENGKKVAAARQKVAL